MVPSPVAVFVSILRGTRNVALVAAAASPLNSLAAQAGPKLHWQTDLVAARALAQEQGKPLFVLFRCER